MAKPFGHFSADSTEYLIDKPFAPPRAQVNFLWNETLIAGLNQFGSGDGVFNGQTLTLNHPEGRVRLIRDGRRYFYLSDLDNGEVWNAGLFPIRPEGATLRTRVGLGYSIFESEYGGVAVTSRVTLAPDEPVEIWRLEVENRGAAPRRIRVTPYVEWLLGGYATFSSPYSYLRSEYDASRRAVLSFNTSDERPHGRYNAFLATDGEVAGWCGGRRDFLGPFGTVTQPRALLQAEFSCSEAWCEELAGALAVDLTLAPGESEAVTFLLGSFDTLEEKDRLIDKVMPASYRDRAWEGLHDANQRMIETVHVETPDPEINRLINVWAKQQIQLCVEFGRDGARGFRDTLQDAWGILPFNPGLAASKIKETLAHQHRDGHAVRGWLPLQPHHYSDGPAWIAPTVAAYVKETGDPTLLEQVVPYLDGGSASVLEHLLTGVRHLSDDTGAHGLVLAHEGDWNDSLNWMGRHGRGESVWTSIALFHSLNVTAEMAGQLLGDSSLKQEMEQRAAVIRAAVLRHGWDGRWFLAGYTDEGRPVGSSNEKQGTVFLNTQTWALLTGLVDGEKKAACLHAIDTMLESNHGSLTLWPPYTTADDQIGRVTMLLPGMYENGTPYCHGTAFKIFCDLALGRADEALSSYRKVMPDNESHPSAKSGCEPYAFTNQYLGPTNGRRGQSISGWITGAAGWMFRAVVEGFGGVKPGYHGFVVDPCLPSDWNEIRLVRPLRGKNRDIRVFRDSRGVATTVDGETTTPGETIAY